METGHQANERAERFARQEEIAGVSRIAPREKYNVDLPFGQLLVTRGSGERSYPFVASIFSANAQLRLTREAQGSLKPWSTHWKPGAEASLQLSGVIGKHYSGEMGDFGELLVYARELFVTHRLLSHPEWLTHASAPTLPEGPGQLLDAMRSTLAGEQRKGALARICCVKCTESDRKHPKPRPNDGSYWSSEHVMYRCPHEPHMRMAATALWKAHPELAFELCGILVPSSDSARYYFAPAIARVMLDHWLLGEATRDDRYGFSYDWGYRGGRFSVKKPPRPKPPGLDDAWDSASLALKTALLFCGSGWGSTGAPPSREAEGGDSHGEIPSFPQQSAADEQVPRIVPASTIDPPRSAPSTRKKTTLPGKKAPVPVKKGTKRGR